MAVVKAAKLNKMLLEIPLVGSHLFMETMVSGTVKNQPQGPTLMLKLSIGLEVPAVANLRRNLLTTGIPLYPHTLKTALL